MNTWTITLHAQGSPLADERTRDTIIAAAHSLAERFNLELVETTATADSFSATLDSDEVTSVGFAAELRRNTNTWYANKHGGAALWRTPD